MTILPSDTNSKLIPISQEMTKRGKTSQGAVGPFYYCLEIQKGSTWERYYIPAALLDPKIQLHIQANATDMDCKVGQLPFKGRMQVWRDQSDLNCQKKISAIYQVTKLRPLHIMNNKMTGIDFTKAHGASFSSFLDKSLETYREKKNLMTDEVHVEKETKVSGILTRLLKSPGFQQEGANKIIGRYVRNPGLNQGTKALREIAAQLAMIAPEEFSPSSLRALQNENPQLIRCLQMKRYSHVFKIRGFADIGDKQFDLEGFSEPFAIGMAHSTLLEFFKTIDDSILDKEDREWISSALKNALYADTAERAFMAQSKDRINGKPQEQLQVIGLGWDWHIFYGLFYKDFILCNRGAGAAGFPGIKIYKLSKDFKITNEQLKHVNRHDISEGSSHYDADVAKRFNCENALIHRERRKDQDTGICGYANIKPLIYSLMAARWMIKHKKSFEKDEWKQAFEAVKCLYKRWSNYDKFKVLEDFAIDRKNSEQDPALKRTLKPIIDGLQKKKRLVNGRYISKKNKNIVHKITKSLML